MSDVAPMNMPAAPESPDLEAIHKWIVDMVNWHQQITLNGVQAPFYSTSQLSQMTELEQAGKIFFDNDSGTFKGAEVSGGVLVIKTFTTS